MSRGKWAAAILVAWAASLGWLVRRELFRPMSARLAEAALSVPPGALYYRVDVGGRQVGLASTTIDTVEAAIRVTDAVTFDVAALGAMHRTSAMSRATVSRSLRLETVDSRFDGDLGRFASRAAVTGDTLLTLALDAGGRSDTARMRLARPIVLPSLLALRLAFGGELKPGRTYTVTVFDPLTLSERPVLVRVGAETTLVVSDSAVFDSTAMAWVSAHLDTVRAFGIEEDAGGALSRAWIDAQGQVVRAQTPSGFTLERAAFEIAYQNFRRRDTVRLARASAAPAPGTVVPLTALAAGVPLRPDTAGVRRFRLVGADPARLGLDGGRQRLAGDTLVVRREDAAALAAPYRLPARDTTLRRYLAPGPLVESDDPDIRARARDIVGGDADPARAARLLAAWVHARVAVRAEAAPPDARRVLLQGAGDANGLALLYVALARAAGLPARTAAGLVYLGDRFYYHAWAEVYLGRWVAVDPMLGEFPADAGHLRFAPDGLARQAELIRAVGRLQLEVL